MTAQIKGLIETPDVSETIRDKIAVILLEELAEQRSLAAGQSKPQTPWEIDVYLQRSNPWERFLTSTGTVRPLICVSWDRTTYNMSGGGVVNEQQGDAIYHIDCYGFGRSGPDGSGGQIAADEKAAQEAQRVKRIARKILMSSFYTYLGMRTVVGRRWPVSEEAFQVPSGTESVQHVMAARLTLEVRYTDTAPQVQGETIEEIKTVFKRAIDDKVLFTVLKDLT